MIKGKKQDARFMAKNASVLESLRGIGSSVVTSFKDELIKPVAENIPEQIFGPAVTRKQLSGEFRAGESISVTEISVSSKREDANPNPSLDFEVKLKKEEAAYIERKSNDLRIELRAIMVELSRLAANTSELSEETKVASMQAPIEPGLYHVIFFEKLLTFIKNFRKQIGKTSSWLRSVNTRAQKKNYWSSYKKQGSKFLLSGEHYVTRSAG